MRIELLLEDMAAADDAEDVDDVLVTACCLRAVALGTMDPSNRDSTAT